MPEPRGPDYGPFPASDPSLPLPAGPPAGSGDAVSVRAEMDRLRRQAEQHPDDLEVWSVLGTTMARYGALREATDVFQVVCRIATDAGNWLGLAQANGGLAWVEHMRMNLDSAEAYYLGAIRICSEHGLDAGMHSQWYGRLGYLYESLGELERAETVYRQALELAENAGLPEQVVRTLGDLADVYRGQGVPEKAEEAGLRALEIAASLTGENDKETDDTEVRVLADMALCEALGHREKLGFDYFSYGVMYELEGEIQRAEDMYLEALAVFSTAGNRHGMAELYSHIGAHAFVRGDWERAADMYGQALELETGLGRDWGVARACRGLGMVCQRTRQWQQARDLYERSLLLVGTDGPRAKVAALCGDLGVVLKEVGEIQRAEGMYRNAMELGEGAGAWEVAARAAAGLGILYLETRPSAEAEARPLLERSLAMYRRLEDEAMSTRLEQLLELLDKPTE
ncbi:MAG: tetratricopeptide repeat protein [Nitrospirota bacterium]|nr:tetratricopeptide repeat protein [Nitrospirota bacterium]